MRDSDKVSSALEWAIDHGLELEVVLHALMMIKADPILSPGQAMIKAQKMHEEEVL